MLSKTDYAECCSICIFIDNKQILGTSPNNPGIEVEPCYSKKVGA